jgi:hypothetical protein
MASLAALPDRALTERTLADECDCFTVLMHRQVAAVRKHVKSMVWNPTDQDEIVQETFSKPGAACRYSDSTPRSGPGSFVSR